MGTKRAVKGATTDNPKRRERSLASEVGKALADGSRKLAGAPPPPIKRRKAAKDRATIEIGFRGAKLDDARFRALQRVDELTGADVLRRLLREECARRNLKVEA